MSDERTRTTKEVRDGYAYDSYSEDVDPYYELRFDRWLAAHDAEIRTATLEEAVAETVRLREVEEAWMVGDAPTVGERKLYDAKRDAAICAAKATVAAEEGN